MRPCRRREKRSTGTGQGWREETEDRDEQVEDKTEFSSDDRDSSFRAANQHIVKFTDELRGVNEQAALNFDRRKNPAEFDMSERREMVEAVEQAFNQAGWNSAFERRRPDHHAHR